MTTEAEFQEEYDQLMADLEAASDAWLEVKFDKEHPDRETRRRRLDNAQTNLVGFRMQWRHIGAAVPDDHPASRPTNLGLGVRIDNNTTTEA